jgi:hypothetical protein
VTDQDKSFSAPVLSKKFPIFPTTFFTTIISVSHSHFPLDCKPSGFCGLSNVADVMILSWTVTIFLFEMEGGEAGPLEL